MIQLYKLIILRFYIEISKYETTIDFSILNYVDWPRIGSNSERGLFRVEYGRRHTQCALTISIFWLVFMPTWRTK